ncbi:MAG: hypothetical protein Q9221_000196 [Calogaya cf. arnoldii]
MQPQDSIKRRNSSFSEQSSKKPRLASEIGRNQTETSHTSTEPARLSDRRRNGQLEERKRGQRLFGALLGTLSQSSSSTANKRRTDVEKKQQAKLRLQAEEHEEQKKQRLESLMAVRRKEQKKYDKQSMHIRHSNMLAQAHFLQTSAEPKLCYKPWELLLSEDARIKSQLEEAERIIQREVAQFDAETAQENMGSQKAAESPDVESKVDIEQPANAAQETVGSETNADEKLNGNANGKTTDKNANVSPPEPQQLSAGQQENLKDHDDDGGEMVEADEDMIKHKIVMDFVGEFLDPRIESRNTQLNGVQYHYLLGQPKGSPRATVFLTFAPLEELVHSGRVPNFGYQLQLASGHVEEAVQSREQIRQLLNGLYGGTTSSGQPGFDVKDGVDLHRLTQLKHTRLMSERLLNFYADQYAKNGMHGTSTKDEALPPSMSRSMDKYFQDLTRKTVDTHHWALWEKPEEVNQIIREWLEEYIAKHKSHL